MQDELAPIVISVYTRLNHFKQCVEALQNNLLADKSEIFIYSDGPIKDIDSELVSKVRDYSHKITGFKKVHIIEREKNYGGTQNASQAHREITKRYGKSIFMEDDIVTAPGFLTFMNEALNFYKDETKIMSITGYCPPIKIPNEYKNDVFILPRFNGWGTGFLLKNFLLSRDSITACNYTKCIQEPLVFKHLMNAGEDYINGGLLREILGIIDAADHRVTYHMAKRQMYTIYPRESLVFNIGHDGTGVHGGNSQKHNVTCLSNKQSFTFPKTLKINEEILENFKNHRRLSFKKKIKTLYYKILIYIRSVIE